MSCLICGTQNPPESRFCNGCGAPAPNVAPKPQQSNLSQPADTSGNDVGAHPLLNSLVIVLIFGLGLETLFHIYRADSGWLWGIIFLTASFVAAVSTARDARKGRPYANNAKGCVFLAFVLGPFVLPLLLMSKAKLAPRARLALIGCLVATTAAIVSYNLIDRSNVTAALRIVSGVPAIEITGPSASGVRFSSWHLNGPSLEGTVTILNSTPSSIHADIYGKDGVKLDSPIMSVPSLNIGEPGRISFVSLLWSEVKRVVIDVE